MSESEPDALDLMGSQFSNETLHRLRCLDGWEYWTTWRRMDDDMPDPPDGLGWEWNTAAGTRGQELTAFADGTPVRLTYWRRRKAGSDRR